MKIDFKYLAPYLPYKLKSYNKFMGVDLIREIDCGNVMGFVWADTLAKPILRPLSDIDDDENNTPEEIQKCCYSYVEKLFEGHFDVFGLIDKGLAVDINTIKK